MVQKDLYKCTYRDDTQWELSRSIEWVLPGFRICLKNIKKFWTLSYDEEMGGSEGRTWPCSKVEENPQIPTRHKVQQTTSEECCKVKAKTSEDCYLTGDYLVN